MKTKSLAATCIVAILTISFISCKKNNSSSGANELETTFELSSNQAIADNLTEDANDVLNEVAVQNNFSGSRENSVLETTGILGCAIVTINPLQGFPKTVTIDFGTAGCTSSNGVYRKGKIIVNVSDSLRKPGSVAVMTFDNYSVNTFKVEGTITWTNTSTANTRSWQRKCENGKITAASGVYWLHNGIKSIEQTAGVSTPFNLLDDAFSITGNHTVTNAAGESRTATILEALKKKTICENIDKGKIKLQGPNHYAIIDFGDGTCDRIATISIDGNTPRTILLY